MPVRAGQLRHRITVYDFEEGRSPTGAILEPEWVVFKKLWASIEPLSVKDVLTARASDSQIKARCVLRYRSDIHSNMQIEHKGRRYAIDGDPLPDAESGTEYITLMLKEVTHG